MDTTITKNFAILAPVPEHHLISGLDAIAHQLDDETMETHPVLALGSNAFEVFGQADALRKQCLADVYIYASHADNPTLNPQATWKATYLKQVHSRRGRYPGKSIHRPEATATDKPTWAIFWLLKDLEKLKKPLPIGNLKGLDKKSNYPPRFLPEAPVLIEHPMIRRRFS
ncbi:hypothetical protein IQ260_04905 [Leptolyngbya cf. ectocarpi LEGE 11479]|uniref:Uncharacterized protein n=1 Tax=Leptolyngbya cf. ectocarpi LEGE 11479 TaxID=1828722 RepID=A0A928X253_LEPEC|nr:hypothetical protein [Leptolyngbya ectocarpi]MBE9065986.1 hypothetical protein [Leptolyngbya cf. ectocarpi LEGE 11479]